MKIQYMARLLLVVVRLGKFMEVREVQLWKARCIASVPETVVRDERSTDEREEQP